MCFLYLKSVGKGPKVVIRAGSRPLSHSLLR